MKLQTIAIALLVTLLVGFGSGFGVRAYIASKDSLQAENADLKADKEELKEYAGKVESRDALNAQLQVRLATLDTSHTRDLNEQLDQNNRLRSDLRVAQRMQLQGARCVADAPAGQADSAGRVGNGASVVLSGETRQAVLDLRADLVRDRAKLLYLHGYVAGLGLTLPDPNPSKEP